MTLLTISNGCPTSTAHTPPTPPAMKLFADDVLLLFSWASLTASSFADVAKFPGDAGMPEVVAVLMVANQYEPR